MIRVWGRKWISDYLFLRKYDNTPFPKKISCSRDVLNTYARASSKGKKVILVLCTHKTPCLSVHRFLRVKVHILCVTDKGFNKIIFRCAFVWLLLWEAGLWQKPLSTVRLWAQTLIGFKQRKTQGLQRMCNNISLSFCDASSADSDNLFLANLNLCKRNFIFRIKRLIIQLQITQF